MTASGRSSAMRVMPFVDILLALELIIHLSRCIFEQGLYLHGAGLINHVICNRFELRSPSPRGGGSRDHYTRYSRQRSMARWPSPLAPASLLPIKPE